MGWGSGFGWSCWEKLEWVARGISKRRGLICVRRDRVPFFVAFDEVDFADMR